MQVAKIFDLFITISNALVSDLFVSRPKLGVQIVTGHEYVLEPLVADFIVLDAPDGQLVSKFVPV